MNGGWKIIVHKIGEETTELIIVSEGNEKNSIVHESADLILHLLVLFAFKDVPLKEVYKELDRRRVASAKHLRVASRTDLNTTLSR